MMRLRTRLRAALPLAAIACALTICTAPATAQPVRNNGAVPNAQVVPITVVNASGTTLSDAMIGVVSPNGMQAQLRPLRESGTITAFGPKVTISVIHPRLGSATVQATVPEPGGMLLICMEQNNAKVMTVRSNAGGVATIGCPGDGDCCSANGTPGCDDFECCELVCAADAFCCDTEWDSICAGEAEEMCSICDVNGVCPGDGDCCSSNGTPGCDDYECCELVCAADPFCCDNSWDDICAGEAAEACGGCNGGLVNDDCDDAILINGDLDFDNGADGFFTVVTGTTEGAQPDPEAQFCGTSVTTGGVWYKVVGHGGPITATFCGIPDSSSDCCVDNGTPGCDDPECEAIVCAQDTFCCDTAWDSLCADAALASCGDLCDNPNASVGEIGADFDTKLSVYCGSCDDLACITGNDDTCGLLSEVTWCSQEGAEYLILVHGFGSGQGEFALGVLFEDGGCKATVQCLVTGACCFGDECVETSSFICSEEGGVFLGEGSNCGTEGGVIVVGSNPNAPIPDNDANGVSDTINVGPSFSIADLNVDLVITHTWVGDLCVSLSKDGGPSVNLIRRMGGGELPCDASGCCGCSEDDMSVTLDDEAVESIESQCTASLSGSYYPDPDALAAYDNLDSSGNWTLTVSDNAGADTGTLNAWALVFTERGGGGESPCSCFLIDFETEDDGVTPLVNGQDLSTPPEFGTLIEINAPIGINLGPAIFDSEPGGGNDPGQDDDLLVGLGNIVILQAAKRPWQTVPGIFDEPDDAVEGGAINFSFPQASELLSIDLIDLCPGGNEVNNATVILFDTQGLNRVYNVQAGFTTDAGYNTLDLTTLDDQMGATAPATAVETAGFDPTSVAQMTVVFNASGALDNLALCPGGAPGGCGDCDQPNPDDEPGCSDEECEEIVCAMDAFCCDTAWDGICAVEAQEYCECEPSLACDCPPDSIEEDEFCGDDDNGGCNVEGLPGFDFVQCGDVICGTAWAEDGTRDTDWYALTFPIQAASSDLLEIRATLTSAFDGVCYILEIVPGCTPVPIGEFGGSSDCQPGTDAYACIEFQEGSLGFYAVFVAPSVFEGVPCGTSNDYVLEIECGPCDPL